MSLVSISLRFMGLIVESTLNVIYELAGRSRSQNVGRQGYTFYKKFGNDHCSQLTLQNAPIIITTIPPSKLPPIAYHLRFFFIFLK